MIVTVELFAGAREAAGADQLAVSLWAGATFGDLAVAMAELEPHLKPLLENAHFASDARYVTRDTPINPTAEIALIPPVSGG